MRVGRWGERELVTLQSFSSFHNATNSVGAAMKNRQNKRCKTRQPTIQLDMILSRSQNHCWPHKIIVTPKFRSRLVSQGEKERTSCSTSVTSIAKKTKAEHFSVDLSWLTFDSKSSEFGVIPLNFSSFIINRVFSSQQEKTQQAKITIDRSGSKKRSIQSN